MAPDLSDDELAALTGPMEAESAQAPEVRPRDFRRPRRLGAERLEALRRALAPALQDAEGELALWLRARPSLTVADVGEITADLALADLEPPFAVLAFEIDALPGWAVWEPPAAIAAVAATLGSPLPEEPEPRALTGVEAGVARELLARLASAVARALDLALDAPRTLGTRLDLLGTLRAAADRDPHRVFVHVAVDGPGGPSVLRLYLPGVGTPGGDAGGTRSSAPAALPEHLDVIPVELTARLGDVEIPLRELLELEPGDVIPLGVPAGSPLRVTVEGRGCATADWGLHRGRQVLRLRALDPPEEDE